MICRSSLRILLFSLSAVLLLSGSQLPAQTDRPAELLDKMTLEEKIGQMWQMNVPDNPFRSAALAEDIRSGRIGSLLNAGNRQDIEKWQKIAVEDSRLGIPLIVGRDVIHGYRTVMPIPLGLACTWDSLLLREAAAVSAAEAAWNGVHWTFAPMLDIARDPRWGRVAESPGEDPYLAEVMARAWVQGFQGEDLRHPAAIAACAKHYVGYGAAEGGRDYNTVQLAVNELRNVYLRPFHAAVNSGALTVMSAFNDLNGVPTSGNAFTIRRVLKEEWQFPGFVVSDWGSVREMIPHGFAADMEEAGRKAALAGVDMEMVTRAYTEHLADLVRRGEVNESLIDEAVLRILRVKESLGLFADPYRRWSPGSSDPVLSEKHLQTAYRAALSSMVLLKNERRTLPLKEEKIKSLLVMGPMADAPADQLGCWAPDGRPEDTVTPLQALQKTLGPERVDYQPVLKNARDEQKLSEKKIAALLKGHDTALLILGEPESLSGEAKNRAFLDLPGSQQELFDIVRRHVRRVIVLVISGRPLTLPQIASDADALLWSFHPGTMGGPAAADLLLGRGEPSGRLAISFPLTEGQIPIYYNHKNTGRPADPKRSRKHPMGTPVDPQGYVSDYLDLGLHPAFPFGYGLSYSQVSYGPVQLDRDTLQQTITASALIKNIGPRPVTETVQLYTRDISASLTRPVRELKAFQRLSLQPGEEQRVSFSLNPRHLSFSLDDGSVLTEEGEFLLWISEHALSGNAVKFYYKR